MTQESKHHERAAEIDTYLGGDAFDSVSLTPENRYQPWYAKLLSSIALLCGNEKVVFAYSDYEPEATDVRIVVFTNHLVLIGDIEPAIDGAPAIRAIPRRALREMKLSSSDQIDARDRRSLEWPGVLDLVLTYEGLGGSIEIVQNGANAYSVNEPSAIVSLIGNLSIDLAQSGAKDIS